MSYLIILPKNPQTFENENVFFFLEKINLISKASIIHFDHKSKFQIPKNKVAKIAKKGFDFLKKKITL